MQFEIDADPLTQLEDYLSSPAPISVAIDELLNFALTPVNPDDNTISFPSDYLVYLLESINAPDEQQDHYDNYGHWRTYQDPKTQPTSPLSIQEFSGTTRYESETEYKFQQETFEEIEESRPKKKQKTSYEQRS